MYDFIYRKNWRSGQGSGIPNRQSNRQTLKDSATQLLRSRSGALKKQCLFFDHILFLDSHVLLMNLAGGILYSWKPTDWYVTYVWKYLKYFRLKLYSWIFSEWCVIHISENIGMSTFTQMTTPDKWHFQYNMLNEFSFFISKQHLLWNNGHFDELKEKMTSADHRAHMSPANRN